MSDTRPPEALRCVATKPRLDPTLPPKQCARSAKYGEWCRQHAESLGGWRLAPPDWLAAHPVPDSGLVDRVAEALDWRHGDDRVLAALLDDLRAALASTPEPDLDVERLARAMANESDTATEDERQAGDLWSLVSERSRGEWRKRAASIATEYTRLRDSKKPTR